MPTQPLTEAARDVLVVFLKDPDKELYAGQVKDQTGRAHGTVHQILKRLVTDGLLTSRQEEKHERFEGRALRQYFSITHEGQSLARRLEHERNRA